MKSRPTVLLGSLAAVSVIVGLGIEMFGTDPTRARSSGADSFSRSSVGHRAFLETLRRTGIEILVSRHRSGDKAGDTAVLALLEPAVELAVDPTSVAPGFAIASAERLFLVCPKWRSVPDAKHPERIESVALRPETHVEAVLRQLGLEARVVRPPSDAAVLAWSGVLRNETIPPLEAGAERDSLIHVLFRRFRLDEEPNDAPVAGELPDETVIHDYAEADVADSLSLFEFAFGDSAGPSFGDPGHRGPPAAGAASDAADSMRRAWLRESAFLRPRLRPSTAAPSLHLRPRIRDPQLLRSNDLLPVLECPAGILIGETRVGDKHVVVVSDPDLIANHGLGRGDNAALAVLALDILHRPGETVVVDEVLHGHASPPNVWREMLRFPLVLVLAQVAMIVALLLLATVGRFGAASVAPAGIRAGKEVLIDSTAGLLQLGGHSPHTLQRYFERTLQEIQQRLHGPEGLDAAALRTWLQRASDTRALSVDLLVLESDVQGAGSLRRGRSAHIVETARRIHQWRREILHEPRDDSLAG